MGEGRLATRAEKNLGGGRQETKVKVGEGHRRRDGGERHRYSGEIVGKVRVATRVKEAAIDKDRE